MSGWSPWKVVVEADFMTQQEHVVVFYEQRDGKRFTLAPPVAVPLVRPGEAINPTWTAEPEELHGLLQAFLNAAWARGMRPKGFEGPQEMKAVQRHLDDMRRLAFHAITSEKA